MDRSEIRALIETWTSQYLDVMALPFINHVQIFENRGPMMGASNPHPHSQIWSNSSIPDVTGGERDRFRAHSRAHGECILCAYGALEEQLETRVVHHNAGFITVVPFWAVWPFELLVMPRSHLAALPDLNAAQREDLAETLGAIARRYDALFDAPFPYSMGFHQLSLPGETGFHLHAHFYPPLLRSATVRKFMVGYELLCAPQRDLTAEQAAQALRSRRDS